MATFPYFSLSVNTFKVQSKVTYISDIFRQLRWGYPFKLGLSNTLLRVRQAPLSFARVGQGGFHWRNHLPDTRQYSKPSTCLPGNGKHIPLYTFLLKPVCHILEESYQLLSTRK